MTFGEVSERVQWVLSSLYSFPYVCWQKKKKISRRFGTKLCNISIWCIFLPLPVFKYFSCPFFVSFFSALLLSLPFSLHILSGCCKELGVNFGQSQIILSKAFDYRHSGPFYHHFCTKTEKVVFQFAMSECLGYPKLTVVRKGLY